ncbi:MAG: glycosyltransferase family 4 protein [Lachnospiraceae bacterium]|nr:glycosyltransferase family 4 protein [Lachnospiraceae bacterium]
MKVLFLTMVWPLTQNQSNMYTDLMGEFVLNRHDVTVLSLLEKRYKRDTFCANENGIRVLRVKCGNIQKTGKYEKVISSLVANVQILSAANKYLKNEKFDLMIFALPPSTIAPVVWKLKKTYNAKFYLLLKEFWPQDPTDLKAMKKNGIVWKFFDFLSCILYKQADYIGTMSDAGIDFLKENTSKLSAQIETCPNCLKNEPLCERSFEQRKEIFKKYSLPSDKIVCVFGGNLGVSQGIPEMINSLKNVSDFEDFCFLIIGDGTEAKSVRESLGNQKNVIIKKWLPVEDYDAIMKNADVGMIFLYPNYSVPNVPSRMVGYLKYGLPVMACIDKATDAGVIIEEHKCGFSVINGDSIRFRKIVQKFRGEQLRKEMSINSRDLFEKKYTSECCYKIIMSHFSE